MIRFVGFVVGLVFLATACTYDVKIDHAVEDLDLTYAPCGLDAGHDASRE